MKIYENTAIRKKFSEGMLKTVLNEWIIIHGTGGGGTLKWMENASLDSEQGKNYKKNIGLFHFHIERDGKITQLLSLDRWAYHASIGAHDEKTIGIELSNTDSMNKGSYTDEQYKSLVWLIEYLIKQFPTINVAMGHRRAWEKISGKKQNYFCPGEGFKWPKFRELIGKTFTFSFDEKYESVWDLKKI